MKTARDIIPRQTLQELGRRRDLPGIVFMTAHVICTLATGMLVYLSSETLWFWPAIVLHGIVIVHFFAPFHEASHYTAFKTRHLNDLAAWFTGLIVILPPTHFRLEHRAHHAHTQDPHKDPEMIPHTRSKLGILWYATAIPYFKSTLSGLSRHPLGYLNDVERSFIPESQRPKVVRDARIMWCVYGSIVLVSLASGSTAALTYWLVPRVIGEPFMRVIRMAEHGALPYVPDMLRNTRTVRSLLPVRLLAWNMAFHAEHHNLPSVPFHALPKLHEYLKSDLAEVRSGYIETQIHITRRAA